MPVTREDRGDETIWRIQDASFESEMRTNGLVFIGLIAITVLFFPMMSAGYWVAVWAFNLLIFGYLAVRASTVHTIRILPEELVVHSEPLVGATRERRWRLSELESCSHETHRGRRSVHHRMTIQPRRGACWDIVQSKSFGEVAKHVDRAIASQARGLPHGKGARHVELDIDRVEVSARQPDRIRWFLFLLFGGMGAFLGMPGLVAPSPGVSLLFVGGLLSLAVGAVGYARNRRRIPIAVTAHEFVMDGRSVPIASILALQLDASPLQVRTKDGGVIRLTEVELTDAQRRALQEGIDRAMRAEQSRHSDPASRAAVENLLDR